MEAIWIRSTDIEWYEKTMMKYCNRIEGETIFWEEDGVFNFIAHLSL